MTIQVITIARPSSLIRESSTRHLCNNNLLSKKMNSVAELIPISEPRKMKVLFINNNPRRHFDIYHHNLNFDFSSTAEAVDRVEKYQRPDAVVAHDSLNKSEILELRRITDNNDMPLILYSQNFDQGAKDLALNLGVDDYFDDSTLSLFESRIKFIKEIRKCKIHWLQFEHDSRYENEATPGGWQLFADKGSAVFSSTALVMLGLWNRLVSSMTEEIRSMKRHTCSASGSKCLFGRMVDGYELVVLILFSPIFLIIKIPLKFKPQEKRFSVSKILGLHDRGVSGLTSPNLIGHGK